MIRSIGAVVAGYAVFAISAVALFQISGRPPESWPGLPFAAFAVIYGGAFALVAGLVVARLSRRAPVTHAMVVAGLLSLAALSSMLLQPSNASRWTQLSTLLVSAPAALLGGFLPRR